ncbi:hypothetical protein HG535_0H03650 [Zygotorulaspora mrakii]|uniref:EKC/KEOPS complex subunit GON7 n=1 Tax=Zygotorulaspora mrakii TaxID=42260 RepID=A0A7H9B8F1_ZYGMR|nr:uncharacterized protein HG535_0H03650 [Zygotorulaspora mrakii]QLG75038.1 hypothetical protein HG535_0H03650 [Zygotorulaspora mrakii]
MSVPFASYSSPDLESHVFRVDPTCPRYQTTDGSTTGPSPHVLNAGQIDKDRPSEPRTDDNGQITTLGQLRCHLTGLQDEINDFLTERMEIAKGKKTKLEESREQRIETEIKGLLDGGDDNGNDDNS